MVIFTILLGALASADTGRVVPNPNCKFIFRHDRYTQELAEQAVLGSLRDQKSGPCRGQMLRPEDPVARCVPFADVDVETINRRLALLGLPRDTTLAADALNAEPATFSVADLVARIMANWDKLYCKDGEYR